MAGFVPYTMSAEDQAALIDFATKESNAYVAWRQAVEADRQFKEQLREKYYKLMKAQENAA